MFVDHQFAEQHRKRQREEEEEGSLGGPVGFTEHRSKRLQSLPLRTSPQSRRWGDPPGFPLPHTTFAVPGTVQTTAPQEPIPEQEMWADEPELVTGNQLSTTAAPSPDGDMDMMDTSESASGPYQPGFQGQPSVEPASFQTDQSGPSVSGRIPTPIHCTFAAQVRSKSWNGGHATNGDALATTPEEPNAAAFGRNGLVDISPQPLGAAATSQVMTDWSMVQNRRLPSPISECGGDDSLESTRMALDSSTLSEGPLSHLTHEHPLLAGLPPRASSAMEGRSVRHGTPASQNQSGNAMDVEAPAATPSPKKGHTRSKHTVNSWTALQPGMKRSFSIGYRADCEKCRMKVPGHFNHIIIS
ncbi:hypothetical protein C8A03DRAFT_19433 [Achaetomium macrosporum]|uniref:Uncharacterized protein n=1 Tax=Achaetomium macrosporum TaxID=79813 RepID=A0AAN7C1E4_9PEZI|nr:hypothetical protein C8A03DRAFT_19433 [Achaetomium macrosporum]